MGFQGRSGQRIYPASLPPQLPVQYLAGLFRNHNDVLTFLHHTGRAYVEALTREDLRPFWSMSKIEV